ncbi:nidogen-1 [Neoarius graeffei]|uniref:nidogen-1 n=1 Tax=Neoarius graeffei TaxID=443677 RepID=UPI00298D32A6|nr:nidogen-1 [Neoarius graeffei]
MMASCARAVCLGLKLLLIASSVSVQCASRSDLSDYGLQFGDQTLQSGTDQTHRVRLDRAVLFFDQNFEEVYVNTNGFVSVAKPPPESEYLGKMPATFGMIAAFLGDLDTSDSVGKVFFRQDTSPELLQRIGEQISHAFPDESKIEPTSAFVVTWENVAAQGTPERGSGSSKKRNTFQLVLASTELNTYAILAYPKDDMHYFSTPVGGESRAIEAGFSQGQIKSWLWTTQGLYYRIPTNVENPDVKKLTELTNSGTRGVWVYKIGSSSFFTNIIPGRVTTVEENAFPQEVTEYPEPRYSGRGEFIEDETTTPEISIPETIPPEPTVSETTFPQLEVKPVIHDQSQPEYKYQPPQANNPHKVYPLPRGPRPVNPEIVVVDEQDEDINVNVFSYRETCANNGHKCSSFADCRDYATGYCCHCRPGFYGNGKDCVAEGKPQRMNGKVNGRIYVGSSGSPVELSNNDLHSYVVVNDGRAYIAVSSIPESVGYSLQPLTSIGGVIGWTFALEQPGYENGFSVIGGVFTRQAEVTFQPGGEKLTINQEFKGIDEHDHLVVSTQLEGRIPEVSAGASVQIDPYFEIYQYASNLITSSSTREYTVSPPDGPVKTLSYLWRQRITYQSCPHDESVRSLPASQQLSVDQVFVMYDSVNNLIRYAMTNKIGPISGTPQQNPCYTGRHGCDTNAVCNPGQGNQFTCQCASGFTGDGRTCYDIDECAETPRICGAHAICNNHPGTFRCECMDGFQFAADGRTCVQVHYDIDHCQRGTHNCDIAERARCTYTGGSAYVCSCLPGFTGDGRTCRDIDECQTSRCHRDAVCHNTQGSFTCRCNVGFYGDGFSCTPDLVREKTACEQHRERALAATSPGGYFFQPRPVVGQYIPTCDHNGEYTPMQCHDSIGQCWCVYPNGEEVAGTRTGPGSRPTCGDHVPVGPTTNPDVRPPPPGANLLFAQNGKIDHIPLENSNMKKEETKTMLHLPDNVVIAVAYDCVDRMVYWTDITQPSISRASIQGGQPTAVITKDLGSPEGIAIDHLSRNMYWTDSVLDRIEVSLLDGQHRRVLFDTDLVNPRAIIADPVNGRLYWSDWNRDSPKIEMSNMDGTDRTVLVNDDIQLPNGLSFEPHTRQLCWADAGIRKVECVNPYTRLRRKVVEGLEYPFDIVSYGGNLYYTDWRRQAVVSVDHVAGKEVDEFLPQKRSRVYGITTTYPQCPQGERNYCSTNNGGCSHLCLPRPSGFTCRCPDARDPTCIERDRNI